MKFTKRKTLLLAAVVAVAVAFTAGSRWFNQPDGSITGLYRRTVYQKRGGIHFRILGRPFTFGSKWDAISTEYELKPKGRYTYYAHHKKWGRGPLPSLENRDPDTTYTIHPDNSYTIGKSGTYTISGRDITFTYRHRAVSASDSNRMELNYGSFVKNGFECRRITARFTKGGFAFVPRSADGKPLSDEEFERRLDSLERVRHSGRFVKVR